MEILGHSMSDPGISYRTREEVAQIRKDRDCIEQLKKLIIENELGTEKEIKVKFVKKIQFICF